jgi:hypothetical protein
MGLAGDAPEGESRSRKIGEFAGGAIPSLATGLAPEVGLPLKAAIGAGTGFAQHAPTWGQKFENAGIGGLSALAGGGAAKYLSNPGVRSSLDRLAEMGAGAILGHGSGIPFGTLGGLWAGRSVGNTAQGLAYGHGPSDLLRLILNNPGLASYLGIKASPYAEKAGEFVGQQLGKPSQ